MNLIWTRRRYRWLRNIGKFVRSRGSPLYRIHENRLDPMQIHNQDNDEEFWVKLEFLWNLGIGQIMIRHKQRRHRPDLASYHDSLVCDENISWLSSGKAPTGPASEQYRALLDNTSQPGLPGV
jgi:hypothetical protein